VQSIFQLKQYFSSFHDSITTVNSLTRIRILQQKKQFASGLLLLPVVSRDHNYVPSRATPTLCYKQRLMTMS